MLHQDVVQWCLSCDTCQRNRKNNAPKAPMVEVPVLAVPFEKVAIDLMGPFERAKSGHHFVLTCIDLASRYPEAIPIREATAEDVAEAPLEIFSRHVLTGVERKDEGVVDRTVWSAQEGHGCQCGTRVTGSKQEEMQSYSRKYYQTLPPTRLQGPSRHGGGRRHGRVASEASPCR